MSALFWMSIPHECMQTTNAIFARYRSDVAPISTRTLRSRCRGGRHPLEFPRVGNHRRGERLLLPRRVGAHDDGIAALVQAGEQPYDYPDPWRVAEQVPLD